MKTTRVIFDSTALGTIEKEMKYESEIELCYEIKKLLKEYNGETAILFAPFNCNISP